MSRETSETIKEDASLKAGLRHRQVRPGGRVLGQRGRIGLTQQGRGDEVGRDVLAGRHRAQRQQDDRADPRAVLAARDERGDREEHPRLNNVAGGGHIAGVYQWVNKVYQAQMFNYGIRMMYDFMVPEPAAFLISVLEGCARQPRSSSRSRRRSPCGRTRSPSTTTTPGCNSTARPTSRRRPRCTRRSRSTSRPVAATRTRTTTTPARSPIDDGYKAVYGVVGIAGNMWEDECGDRCRARPADASLQQRSWRRGLAHRHERRDRFGPVRARHVEVQPDRCGRRGEVPAHRAGRA